MGNSPTSMRFGCISSARSQRERDRNDRVRQARSPHRFSATLPTHRDASPRPDDRAYLEALLASTSVIESHRAGNRRIVVPQDDYVGDLREHVLAPFAYRSPSRFSDGSFGVLYAGECRETALHEAISRLARVYLDGKAPPAEETRKQHLTLRVVADDLVDVRTAHASNVDAAIYDSTDYAAARSFGSTLRDRYPGLTYDSVRHRGGVCVGVFIPRIVSDVRLESILSLVWDGARFVESKDIHPL